MNDNFFTALGLIRLGAVELSIVVDATHLIAWLEV